ncbi:MAG TPA: DUF4389 domain-containing protein [Solirubrobacterales bacterium]|nr:DUF4389 domain-containing protein [Solirubrobacterales bacterium]
MASDRGVRPVRLTIADDLRRNRATVFFRFLLALPLMVWLVVWAVGAFVVAVVNWGATLVLGRSPSSLHRFLARFVRYATHAFAYLNLAAGPFPGFLGRPGYPIDLEIDQPERQNRWSVACRLVLAVPAMLLVAVLAGYGANIYSALNSRVGLSTVLSMAAFLGWFSALARGRMPRGLRDLAAYGLSYGAQLWAYLLLLTDRYPSSDPLKAIGPLPVRNAPVRLDAGGDLRRSRLTVFFRVLLALPHLVWLTLWGILAVGAAIINWFATLIRATPPRAIHRLLAAYLRYQAHVTAYLFLIGNPFPGFTGSEGTYPVELHVDGPQRQNRWTVLFRLVLVVPAFFILAVYNLLLTVVALLGWFASLITGRMPTGLRNAGALVVGYLAQTYAYLLIVTDTYPNSGPAEPRPAPAFPRQPLPIRAPAAPPPVPV